MNRLLDLREDNDLTQEDLGKILGITQRKYSFIECGDTDLKSDILEKLADYYNTSVDYILYRTDIRDAYPKSIMNENKTTKSTSKK